MKRCKRCVMGDTRPRITFDENGICSACQHWERKEKTIDWKTRRKELEKLCDTYRSKDGNYDCIVPVSGGKDSSYVTWNLKHMFGMHPLTVTFACNEETDIGRENLIRLIDSGFDNILITPNRKIHRKLVKKTFIEFGDPFLPFVYGQMAAPFRIAVQYKIPLIFYGENGEVEYGGSTKNMDKPRFGTDFVKKLLYSEQNLGKWIDEDIPLSDLYPYRFPSEVELKKAKVKAFHFSYYENWKPFEHYKLAKEKCGFKSLNGRSECTYTNFASLDDKHDGFHYYMMLLKFGTSRATSDAAHEIRENRITRDEGLKLIQKYDTEFPKEHFNEFLNYIGITKEDFWISVKKFINSDVWTQISDNQWKLNDKETNQILETPF